MFAAGGFAFVDADTAAGTASATTGEHATVIRGDIFGIAATAAAAALAHIMGDIHLADVIR